MGQLKLRKMEKTKKRGNIFHDEYCLFFKVLENNDNVSLKKQIYYAKKNDLILQNIIQILYIKD